MSIQRMTLQRKIPCSSSLLALSAGLFLVGCSDDKGADNDGTTTNSSNSVTITVTNPEPTEGQTTASSIDPTNDPTLGKLDLPDNDTVELGCNADGACNLLDVLFVIDNSGTMGEEQTNLAKNFPFLIQKIRELKDENGEPVNADVNIMVTTTDFGHPLCSPFEKADYDPAKGAPINTACTARPERFNSLDGKVTKYEACSLGCPEGNAAVPTDPFIHFNQSESNVMGGDPAGDLAAQALSCIGPQGIDGCGMEAPLETMLQALDPNKPWNGGGRPFLRKGAVLAIVMMTDEAECSVKDYKYFDPKLKDDPMYNQYWEIDPKSGTFNEPTSAVCHNAGVSCTDANADGIYESCMSEDKGVLQPLTRYTSYLKDILVGKEKKEVVMLGILGVPLVTAHNPDPPYQPTEGGVKALVYRDWQQGDILPPDTATPQQKQYEFGIGPGCTGMNTGQAIPNTRVIEVCQGLDTPASGNQDEKIRCCIESICDDDFSDAINCLAGILQETLQPAG